jgi:MOSC domain-containing protein YiiM
MTTGARLTSIQVGQPRSLGSGDAESPFDAPWTSGIFKRTVDGPVGVSRNGLDGDGQADLVNHGGADKAICAYAADHYDDWRQRLNLDLTAFPYGAFGENFTLRELTEADVCIGDTWRIGRLLVQVSQPRQPCWKLARKWRIKTFADDVIRSGRTGWYFRVIEPAHVDTGDACEIIARPNPEWTIARANAAMHTRPFDRQSRAALVTVPLLSAAWQRTLSRSSGD